MTIISVILGFFILPLFEVDPNEVVLTNLFSDQAEEIIYLNAQLATEGVLVVDEANNILVEKSWPFSIGNELNDDEQLMIRNSDFITEINGKRIYLYKSSE